MVGQPSGLAGTGETPVPPFATPVARYLMPGWK
jgi:hypothetical protein